ncbi:MAG: 6,7-dimethyl-8-ribityllumazine synthase [Acidimicrobiales bacterium]
MTSSDLTVLPEGAKDEAAARVGAVVDADGPSTARVAFVCAEFNGGITARLLAGALDVLDERGVAAADRALVWVPGAFEAPLASARLAGTGRWDAVVCLGAVIRGDTGHYDFVAGQCAAGIQRVQLDTGVPVVFGVLTTDTVEQALERSLPDGTNKGREASLVALAMASVVTGAGALA